MQIMNKEQERVLCLDLHVTWSCQIFQVLQGRQLFDFAGVQSPSLHTRSEGSPKIQGL